MNDRTTENYLKNIYHLSQGNSVLVSNKQIAIAMGISPASVTEAVRKLAKAEYIIYEKSYGTRLTSEGLMNSLSIIRRHRLWETFLVNELGFGWEEVHEIAEELEHVKNDKLINRLAGILGNPIYDPHGDPIPDEYGNIEKSNFIKLSESKIDQEYLIKGVTDHTIPFLKYLEKQQLTLGIIVKIKGIEEFDHSIIIDCRKKETSISLKVAENIIVQERN
ncbi:MAG: metal-dependent transcriptional regulator [Crocinitomicaceae bacterium]|nr:metal-dependent transcriptional regulator [Crocinitomicaceae bacterium]MCF8409892.1 metal-dependent transcriptional regulator [Crocinitomicaceae bacterium]